MAHATPSEAEVASTLSKLEISPKTQTTTSKPKSTPVAESWDQESSGSDTETETTSASLSRVSTSDSSKGNNLSPINTTTSHDIPNPPPPTPASPTLFEFPSTNAYGASVWDGARSSGRATSPPVKRPEKTTAVAGRLIAAGLGVRPPKRTEEERAYDKATREKLKKQRDEERERETVEKEQAEARRKAVWED